MMLLSKRVVLQSLFATAWWFIIIVSLVDAYLLLLTREVIAEYELNPAGNVLLAIANGQVWLFLLLKYLGTVIVSACLLLLYRKNLRLGLSVALGLVAFQFGLLVFLCFA